MTSKSHNNTLPILALQSSRNLIRPNSSLTALRPTTIQVNDKYTGVVRIENGNEVIPAQEKKRNILT